jgi:hypothetical protein
MKSTTQCASPNLRHTQPTLQHVGDTNAEVPAAPRIQTRSVCNKQHHHCRKVLAFLPLPVSNSLAGTKGGTPTTSI